MVKACSAIALLALVSLLLPLAGSAPASDWLTWGYDQERSGWNRAETTLSKENVSSLALQWSAQLPTTPREIALSTLTAPLVVEGVTTSQGRRTLVFVVGSDDTVFAIDADSGKTVWEKAFPNTLTPHQTATWLCSNTQNSTPVIDKQKGIIYLNTSDGNLRGLSLSTGDERMTPAEFVTPFARNWSLNLIDDVIYSPTARGCGGAIANISAMDVRDPGGPPSKSAPPFKFSYGDAPRGSVMAFQVSGEDDKLSLIPMWISRDMHVPDPPVVANGVVYAIQTGENTVQNPRPGGDVRGDPTAAGGVARGGQAAQAGQTGSAQGTVPGAGRGGPGGGGGAAAAASAQAAATFRATPVSNLVLYAFDAETGKQLYSSEKIIPGWVHYGEPVVAAGKVFVVTWDAHVYAFGLKK